MKVFRKRVGIWFVFSKQYSDKLSEDISRGNKKTISSGKARGIYKHGYFINNEGYHEPHGKFFKLIQEAFQKKLDNEPESKIKDFLNSNGYFRLIKKNKEEKAIGRKSISTM